MPRRQGCPSTSAKRNTTLMNQLQLRRDTAERWASVNPTLREGEPTIVLENGKLVGYKIGDGVNKWADLPYYEGKTLEVVDNLTDGGSDKALSAEMGKRLNSQVASLLWSDASLSLSGGKVIHAGVATPVTLTATFTSATLTPDTLTIALGGTTLEQQNGVKTLEHSENMTKASGDYAYKATAVLGDNTKTATSTVQARNKVYCGMAASIAAAMVDGNALSPVTSAKNTYTRTASANGQRFFLCVPKDVTAPSADKFTMGGAPVAIVTEKTTVGGVEYTVFSTSAIYNNGVSLTIKAE